MSHNTKNICATNRVHWVEKPWVNCFGIILKRGTLYTIKIDQNSVYDQIYDSNLQMQMPPANDNKFSCNLSYQFELK